jgi:branched-subunit amino acid transport protein
MSHLLMIILMAVITFATRISFLLRPLPSARIRESRFLHVFPVALFVALAADGLLAPAGLLEVSPSLAAGVGGIIGAVLFKRSILGIIAMGLVGYWIARLLV